jgi:FlaA1/EpsC-like NDP-sugar epimerase
LKYLLHRYSILFIDVLFTVIALLLAFLVRSEFHLPIRNQEFLASSWPFFLLIQPAVFYLFGTHRLMISRITFEDSVRLLASIATGTLLLALIVYPAHGFAFPRSIFILFPLILAAQVISLRYFGRFLYERRKQLRRKVEQPPQTGAPRRTLVVGAGSSGIQLMRALRNNPAYRPIGFLDDDATLQGKELVGLPILGRVDQVVAVATQQQAEEVLLAIPSADGSLIRSILQSLVPLKIPVRILPRMLDSLEGRNPTSQLRQIRLDDLLRRAAIVLENECLSERVTGKRILVTGAAGSIGSELCRQLLKLGPQQLILVDMAESPLYEISRELEEAGAAKIVHVHLADITRLALLEPIFSQHRPQWVFHAAAYKHVPLLESHPHVAITNNLRGGLNVAELARRHQVERVVLVSTDKAVNPTNLMGMTKRILEHLFLAEGHGETRFSVVRFGNVLGSQGSIIPTFERQLAQGGPLTVTHPEIRRFFMTIPEAVQLVLQACSMGEGGEIYVLDMGEPVRILDLARDFIELNGFRPDVDIEIRFIGLRPGEKLFEELFSHQEVMVETPHPKIRVAKGGPAPKDILPQVEKLLTYAEQRDARAFALLESMVPEATWHRSQLWEDSQVTPV